MEISTNNINNLVKCLQATLSPDPNERKQGKNNKQYLIIIYVTYYLIKVNNLLCLFCS